MIRIGLICLIQFVLLFSVSAQRGSKAGLSKQFIEYQFRSAGDQYRVLRTKTPDNVFPRSYAADLDRAVTSQSNWWCSGFYSGTLLLLFEYTRDDSLKQEALRKLKLLEKEQFNKGTHDLGFKMYCSFGNALRIFKDSAAYKPILINAAKSLSTRYNANTKTIRSWDHGSWQFPVIIDNMM
ncbi:MAG TPA: hypothetical protein VK625_22730, partial [Flavitalea sp.]|nr:hypothetical protein [Flavitalea sp.]